ncbi:hypothetical protein M0D69_30310 [Caballeronia sp. SEWSISQ10-4 2]|uniref:hypothetical protein n=1 Tax=Caballeronia sp. SEWSISQ10-4 2 TaxID=2937438 RepID=UPI00264E2F7F|nr:hypothetical protein [Caballeronia sp. SEWSISQ10-4 2]MDN7182235.1 hypothetical protein [Caballeronia sp. SEWSISQ10-4 2]
MGDTLPHLCHDCIKDDVLQPRVTNWVADICAVCHRDVERAAPLYALGSLAKDFIRERFEDFDDTLYDYQTGLTLSRILQQLLTIDSDAIGDQLAVYLRANCAGEESAFFGEGMCYS